MRWFQEDLTGLAFCWRLTRRDGVRLGFTSHDRDLMIDGLRYRAAPGMAPSAVETGDGLEAANVDIAGALSSDAITARDLADGRWDGAAMRLTAHDWQMPQVDPVPLLRGELGAVSLGDGQFSAELIGPEAVLDGPACPETSPLCRAVLGDRQCRVDMAGRSRFVTFVSGTGCTVTVSGSHGDGVYAHGRVRWMSGPNSGLDGWVDGSIGGTLQLREAPRHAPQPGDLMLLIEGCDHVFETCRTRFANAANFRAEPHLPGNDLLTRYAG